MRTGLRVLRRGWSCRALSAKRLRWLVALRPKWALKRRLDWDPLTSDADPDQQLIIYAAEPGSRSEQALRELAAWAAENIGPSH